MQSGILRGNIADLGDFDECLKVKHMEIRGKYCLISLDPAIFTKVRLYLQVKQNTKNDAYLGNIGKKFDLF